MVATMIGHLLRIRGIARRRRGGGLIARGWGGGALVSMRGGGRIMIRIIRGGGWMQVVGVWSTAIGGWWLMRSDRRSRPCIFTIL